MTSEEAKDYLLNVSYMIGTTAVEYMTLKDGDKIREAIEALTVPSADSSIPISWIEKYIDWLNGLESPFSTITALQVSLMVKRWKGDCPLPVNFFPDGKE